MNEQVKIIKSVSSENLETEINGVLSYDGNWHTQSVRLVIMRGDLPIWYAVLVKNGK